MLRPETLQRGASVATSPLPSDVDLNSSVPNFFHDDDGSPASAAQLLRSCRLSVKLRISRSVQLEIFRERWIFFSKDDHHLGQPQVSMC